MRYAYSVKNKFKPLVYNYSTEYRNEFCAEAPNIDANSSLLNSNEIDARKYRSLLLLRIVIFIIILTL